MNDNKENEESQEMRGKLRDFLLKKRGTAPSMAVEQAPKKRKTAIGRVSKAPLIKPKVTPIAPAPCPTPKIAIAPVKARPILSKPAPLAQNTSQENLSIAALRPAVYREQGRNLNACRRALLFSKDADVNCPVTSESLEYLASLPSDVVQARREKEVDAVRSLSTVIKSLEERSGRLASFEKLVFQDKCAILKGTTEYLMQMCSLDVEFGEIVADIDSLRDPVDCLALTNHFPELTDLKRSLEAIVTGIISRHSLVDSISNFILLNSIG
ncbi:hypothetical protein PSACC_01505 [Paramicrosporidium saccamoebae]|uniref:Uncharacterized protein n=1 Tax=Paramicrosporidium saccamoebae TaxID=1246581 RepID=A0A2H9TLT7_9FUNG|nr:hypothetical protein PSACC_01505 [Paramicrosporidium saccamoebae]